MAPTSSRRSCAGIRVAVSPSAIWRIAAVIPLIGPTMLRPSSKRHAEHQQQRDAYDATGPAYLLPEDRINVVEIDTAANGPVNRV